MNQAIILRGNIEKVFYAGPKFSAGRLRGTDGKSHSFAGNLFATEGQHIALAGRWEEVAGLVVKKAARISCTPLRFS